MSTTLASRFMSRVDSPVGVLTLCSDGERITALRLPNARPVQADAVEAGTAVEADEGPLAEARRQLAEYFARRRRSFDLPLAPRGTAFQQGVWRALQDIPYGETVSYGDIARRLGNPRAVRAVGLANGRNPIAIVIPCHRVIGADGSLTGYGGGLACKRALLELEAGTEPLHGLA